MGGPPRARPSAPEAPALFEAHLHPEGVSDSDLETARLFGVERALLFALPISDPTPKRLLGQLEKLASVQAARVERAGIHAYVALGVHPQSLPRRGLREVLARLPELFDGRAVALGEIGLFKGGEAEEDAFAEQLELAVSLKLPVVVHTPLEDKERLTRQILRRLQQSGLPAEHARVDHLTPKTVRPVLARGHWAGLSIHPEVLKTERAVAWVRRLGPERLMLDADVGAGAGDLLALPRAFHLLDRSPALHRVAERVAFKNAARFLRL